MNLIWQKSYNMQTKLDQQLDRNFLAISVALSDPLMKDARQKCREFARQQRRRRSESNPLVTVTRMSFGDRVAHCHWR